MGMMKYTAPACVCRPVNATYDCDDMRGWREVALERVSVTREEQEVVALPVVVEGVPAWGRSGDDEEDPDQGMF